MLTLAGGVAVAEGIREATGLPVNIKWPNDIVVRDDRAPGRRRKLAGILAEAATGGSGVQHVILGIGVNVRRVDYPADLAARITSLEHELGRPVDTGLVLSEILAGLNQVTGTLDAGGTAGILARWRTLSPGASGAQVSWRDHGVTVQGVTAGIDSDGALLIRTSDTLQRVISGEVLWD
jgi:BirA family biotin operon repressor/biotin-[acetyl-CoA-carboxylase] ligase